MTTPRPANEDRQRYRIAAESFERMRMFTDAMMATLTPEEREVAITQMREHVKYTEIRNEMSQLHRTIADTLPLTMYVKLIAKYQDLNNQLVRQVVTDVKFGRVRK